MREILGYIYTCLLVVFLTGCCSMPGQSGIDCSKYAENISLALKLNFDSTQNGFTLNEADSTYIIVFNNLGFKNPSDTITLNRSFFITQNSRTPFKFGKIIFNSTQDYLDSTSYIIKNKYSNIDLRIDSVQIKIVHNDNKCCNEYSYQTPKSYYISGQKIVNETIVTLNKN